MSLELIVDISDIFVNVMLLVYGLYVVPKYLKRLPQ